MDDSESEHQRQYAALVGTIAAVFVFLLFSGPSRYLAPIAVGVVVWRAVIYAGSRGLRARDLPKPDVANSEE